MLLDAIIVVALLLCRPSSHMTGIANIYVRACWCVSVGSFIIFASVVFWSRHRDGGVREPGVLVDDINSLVLLDPKLWKGRHFPLEKVAGLGDQIEKGRWLIVLLHHDCSHCIELLVEIQKATRLDVGIALVELPPFGTSPIGNLLSCDNIIGRLPATYDWFVDAPAMLIVENGIVRHVELSAVAEKFGGFSESSLIVSPEKL